MLYDPAVFLTQEEINQQYPSITNIQAFIETPEIHLVGVSSSGHAEQAVLIPDRLPCIQELSDSVHTSSGIEIQDTLRFFKGDCLHEVLSEEHSKEGLYGAVAVGYQVI